MSVKAPGCAGVASPTAEDWLAFAPDILGMQVVDTGKQGLGHTVRVVPELEEADPFCREVFGNAPEQIVVSALDLRFYHCNPRHHSLALGGVPSAGPAATLP